MSLRRCCRFTVRAGGFVFAALMMNASAAVRAETPAETPLKIGYITDLTGMGAFFGVQSQRGALLAAEDLSKERPVSIRFEDVAGKIPNAVTALSKLLTVDKVDAVICDLTPVCTAIADPAEAAGKPLIYHSPATSIAAKHQQAFRNFIDYTAGCAAMAEYWQAHGSADVGSLNGNLEFGERCLEGVNKVFPGHYGYRNNPGDDLRSAALAFRDRKLSHIIFTGFEADFLGFLKQARSQSIPVTPGFIELLLTESLWKQLGDDPFSALVAGFEELPPEFEARVRSRFNAAAGVNLQAAALAYNAVHGLQDAFLFCEKHSPPAAITLDCLKQRLQSEHSGYFLGFRGFLPGVPEYPVVLKTVDGKSVRPIAPDQPPKTKS